MQPGFGGQRGNCNSDETEGVPSLAMGGLHAAEEPHFKDSHCLGSLHKDDADDALVALHQGLTYLTHHQQLPPNITSNRNHELYGFVFTREDHLKALTINKFILIIPGINSKFGFRHPAYRRSETRD